MCWNWFIEKRYGIKPPSPLIDIGFSDIFLVLQSAFPDAKIYLSDSKYQTTTLQELKRFLAFDTTNTRKYTSEWFDCDDFSAVLNGNINIPYWERLPFGILWTDTGDGYGHAVNVFVDNLFDVYIVEPQNDKVFECPKKWKPYMIIM